MGSLVEDVKNLGTGWIWYLALINTGGLDPSSLPSLQGYKDSSGKSTLCACGMMGLCKFDTNRCKFVCPDARDITDEFVNKYVQVMKPVLAQYLRKKTGGQRSCLSTGLEGYRATSHPSNQAKFLYGCKTNKVSGWGIGGFSRLEGR